MDAFLEALKDSRYLQIFVGALPILTGAAGWIFARYLDKSQRGREREEDAARTSKAERKRDDFEHYKILISLYQNFLVLTLPYVELNIHPDQKDLNLAKGSPEYARRQILYEYLFYMFERAYMLQDAMKDTERLGDSVENRWKGWEIWIESYLKRKSVQDEFESVKDYGLNTDFQRWVAKKITELETPTPTGHSKTGNPKTGHPKTWEPVAPDR